MERRAHAGKHDAFVWLLPHLRNAVKKASVALKVFDCGLEGSRLIEDVAQIRPLDHGMQSLFHNSS
jgi:hypothetical protein